MSWQDASRVAEVQAIKSSTARALPIGEKLVINVRISICRKTFVWIISEIHFQSVGAEEDLVLFLMRIEFDLSSQSLIHSMAEKVGWKEKTCHQNSLSIR